MRPRVPPIGPLGVALRRHLQPTASWLAVAWLSFGRPAVKERRQRGYPATKGSPGGKAARREAHATISGLQGVGRPGIGGRPAGRPPRNASPSADREARGRRRSGEQRARPRARRPAPSAPGIGVRDFSGDPQQLEGQSLERSPLRGPECPFLRRPVLRTRHLDIPPAYRLIARSDVALLRASGCQRTSPAGYPATKGRPGGKLPAGNDALRSPAFRVSAAVLKSATNQE